MTAPRDDSVYLKHVLAACLKIEKFVQGVDRSGFLTDEELQSAVLYQIQIVGEASKRLSEELKTKYGDVAWKAIAGMRDKIVHDYMGVDLDYVWQTVSEDIPAFKKQIGGILKEDFGIE